MYGNGRPGATASGVSAGKIFFWKWRCQLGALLLVELAHAEQADVIVGQRWAQLAFKAVGQAPSQLEHALADQRDRLRGRAPVLTRVLDARVDLIAQPGHAHHVELVEVGRVDRAELDPLQQRRALVLGELQHAVVEVQPRALAVDVQRGVLQVASRLVVLVGLARSLERSRALRQIDDHRRALA